MKTILELIVLGHRPVTTLSILSILVGNRNRPMYGAQIGREMEEKFQLPKGWFTKTRYYDTRVGKLLKILCRLDILEETEIVDSRTKRRYVGYYISKHIYPTIRGRIVSFLQDKGLPIFSCIQSPEKLPETETRPIKRCTKCQALTVSLQARYCELCGNPLRVVCKKCGKENSLEYLYCLHCGDRLTS